jgi:hypothetical protein
MGWGRDDDQSWLLKEFRADLLDPICYAPSPAALRMTCRSATYRGDQEWIAATLRKHKIAPRFIQDMVPGIVSYKVHVKDNGGPPSGTRVVCFHGQPKPRDVAHESWMPQEWKSTGSEVAA